MKAFGTTLICKNILQVHSRGSELQCKGISNGLSIFLLELTLICKKKTFSSLLNTYFSPSNIFFQNLFKKWHLCWNLLFLKWALPETNKQTNLRKPFIFEGNKLFSQIIMALQGMLEFPSQQIFSNRRDSPPHKEEFSQNLPTAEK